MVDADPRSCPRARCSGRWQKCVEEGATTESKQGTRAGTRILFLIQFALLGILVAVGLLNWFSMMSTNARPASVEVQAPALGAEEAGAAAGSSTSPAAPAGEDAARLHGDPAEETPPTLSPGSLTQAWRVASRRANVRSSRPVTGNRKCL